jgi:hypothetical protein
MKKQFLPVGAAVLLTAIFAVPSMTPASAEAPSGTRLIPSGGTTTIRNTPAGVDSPVSPFELRPDGGREGEGNGGVKDAKSKNVFPKRPLPTPRVRSSRVASSNPEVQVSVEGLNARDQRLANGGNQFSIEPPDQALCVGNGYVVESVNSVLRVYDTNGNPLTGVQDLNTFFNYPAAIDRSTFTVGPNVIDPVCLYDPDNGRFVVAITTLHVDSDGNFSGRNTIDVAVSNTNDPTGPWTVYYVPAQNDGTEGTPNHGCTLDGVAPGPCFQDYPHLGADEYGVYVSTNEYDLFGPAYNAAQVFAFSKKQLAAHPSAIDVTLVENLSVAGTPGFTVWPATSPEGEYEQEAHGTEYFLSTIAGDGSETGNPTGTADKIGVWALSNTRSLDSASPDLRIGSRLIKSATYVFPDPVEQKTGDTPLRDCLNDNTDLFGPGLGCWYLFLDPPTAWQPEVQSMLDAGDTRMQQTWYVDDVLWGALTTAVEVGGETKAGILWFKVEPEVNDRGRVKGKVEEQGYIALEDNNLTYPAIALNSKGKGVIAFTLVGEDHYPSAGYVTIDDDGDVGPIHVAGEGLGPSDGFTSYKAFVGDPPRTRWGDYGAAVTDGRDIWMASEYVAQTCDLDQYLFGGPIGSCDGTRTALTNWSTRLTKVRP